MVLIRFFTLIFWWYQPVFSIIQWHMQDFTLVQFNLFFFSSIFESVVMFASVYIGYMIWNESSYLVPHPWQTACKQSLQSPNRKFRLSEAKMGGTGTMADKVFHSRALTTKGKQCWFGNTKAEYNTRQLQVLYRCYGTSGAQWPITTEDRAPTIFEMFPHVASLKHDYSFFLSNR